MRYVYKSLLRFKDPTGLQCMTALGPMPCEVADDINKGAQQLTDAAIDVGLGASAIILAPGALAAAVELGPQVVAYCLANPVLCNELAVGGASGVIQGLTGENINVPPNTLTEFGGELGGQAIGIGIRRACE